MAGGHAVSGSTFSLLGEVEGLHVQGNSVSRVGRSIVPGQPVILHAGELVVAFDAKAGLPHSYRFKGSTLWGVDDGKPSAAVVCRLQPREYQTVTPVLTGVRHLSKDVLFDFQVDLSATPAATYSLRYASAAAGAAFILTLESVAERAGFQLIEVAVPQLVAVRQEDGPAWMAEGRHGGSFVRLQEAKAHRVSDNEFFGRISTELPVGMIGTDAIGCMMEVTAYMDGTETEITGVPGSHHATMGCILTHRVHGGRCSGMNDGGKPVCGNSSTLNIPIGQMPRTRFDFFSCAGEQHPWLNGAKIMRKRMPPAPTEYFSDRLVYIIAGKRKIDAEPKSTFAQSKALVHDIALLTDYAPQVGFISGFAYEGQDTGFPSEDKINSSLGTDAELLALIQSSRKLNANITLNVNYDDSYKSSPLFDEAFIARRPDGEIWKSRAWDGEDSYVTGMAKYMSGGWGATRVAFTVDHFKIKDAILIDAMSWFAVRNDWDPQHPASGYKNLIDGKFKVLEEFHKRGVWVTSEQLRYPFLGRLAESMDGPGISSAPFGGEAIPLLATIYRGTAIWGGNGDGSIHPQLEIFWNTRSCLWYQGDSDRRRATDFYYLVTLPYSKLNRLSVESYESRGSTRRLVLEQQSEVSMDTSGTGYTARFRGVEVARDNATFCPIDESRIAFYSQSARQLRYPIPEAWRQDEVVARRLTLNGRVDCKVSVKDGFLMVDVQPKQPVIVYANERALSLPEGRTA